MPENNDNEKRVIVGESCKGCALTEDNRYWCPVYDLDIGKYVDSDTTHPDCPLPKASDFVGREEVFEMVQTMLFDKPDTLEKKRHNESLESVLDEIKSMPGMGGGE